MANRKLLSVIYPGLSDSDDCTRINPMVRASDCRQIVSVAGDTHILSHICQLAIKTTADYVRLHKLDFTTSDQLAEFLRERSPFTPPSPKTDACNDAGRDKGGDKQVTNTAHGKPESGKSVTGGSGKDKGKAGKR